MLTSDSLTQMIGQFETYKLIFDLGIIESQSMKGGSVMGVIITASVFGLVCGIIAWGTSKADEMKNVYHKSKKRK